MIKSYVFFNLILILYYFELIYYFKILLYVTRSKEFNILEKGNIKIEENNKRHFFLHNG